MPRKIKITPQIIRRAGPLVQEEFNKSRTRGKMNYGKIIQKLRVEFKGISESRLRSMLSSTFGKKKIVEGANATVLAERAAMVMEQKLAEKEERRMRIL